MSYVGSIFFEDFGGDMYGVTEIGDTHEYSIVVDEIFDHVSITRGDRLPPGTPEIKKLPKFWDLTWWERLSLPRCGMISTFSRA